MKKSFPRPSNNERMRQRALSAAARDTGLGGIMGLNRIVVSGTLDRKWRTLRLKEKGLLR